MATHKPRQSSKSKTELRYQPSPRGNMEGDDHPGRCERWRKGLLCIDLQYLGCAEGFGVFENHRKSGVTEAAIQYFLDRVNETIVPNVNKLQNSFRSKSHEVLHCRIQSLTQDGRDRSPEHKQLELHAPPGSKLAEFLPDVAPLEDEVVINKTASGVFISTNIEYVLRNLCISELFIAGVLTNECISSAARSASDLGFQVYVLSDACAGITEELHEATLLTMRDRYAKVITTEEGIKLLEQESNPDEERAVARSD